MRAWELLGKSNLTEGELIPLPDRTIRVVGDAHEMYQITKLLSNPNLAHKVNFQYRYSNWGTPGANPTDIVLSFLDQVSFEEAKKVLDHFGVEHSLVGEFPSELFRKYKPFQSTLTPPDDGDAHFGGTKK